MPRLRLFEKPEETPPGLDAIRAWIRKPRPRLHGLWTWIRWILSGIPESYRYCRKNWPAARERIRRLAAEGEKVARAVVRAGHVARDIGGGIVRSTRALRGPDGKVSGAIAGIRELGRTVRGFGGRLSEGGTGIAAAFSGVGRLVRARHGNGSTGFGLLDPPEERERSIVGSPRASRPGTPTSRPAPSKALRRKKPRPAPQSAGDAPVASEPSAPPGRPAGGAAPQGTATDEWIERLEGLPRAFIPRVRALGERPRRNELWSLIFNICAHREWTTPAELARWLSMHQHSLGKRHLRPMTKQGLLELQFPDRRSSPNQAYRARLDNPSGWKPDTVRPSSHNG